MCIRDRPLRETSATNCRVPLPPEASTRRGTSLRSQSIAGLTDTPTSTTHSLMSSGSTEVRHHAKSLASRTAESQSQIPTLLPMLTPMPRSIRDIAVSYTHLTLPTSDLV